MTSAGQYKLVKIKSRSQDPKQSNDIRDHGEESKGRDDSYLINVDWKNNGSTGG